MPMVASDVKLFQVVVGSDALVGTYWNNQKRIFAGFAGLIFVFSSCVAWAAGADVQKLPSPAAAPSSPTPLSQARSLAMLWQVAKQLEQYVRSKELTAIHNEDVVLVAASNELFAQATSIAPGEGEAFKSNLTNFCQRVSTLHLAADLNQEPKSEAELSKVLEAFEKVKAHFAKQVVADAQAYLDTYMCPMHRDVVGKQTDFCPKCGMPLDQLCRVLPAGSEFPAAGQQTVRASIRTATPLKVGQPVSAILHLEKGDGDPVLLSDLIETHTKKIHLFIIDNSLSDYHHEHPEPTRTLGEYSFTFTPAKPGGYRVWADLRPSPLGLQEYAMTDIPAETSGAPLTNRELNTRASVDGLNYEVVFDQKTIQVGKPASARLRVTNKKGESFTELEPVMAAFAHLVGFNEDYKTVLHIHPKGAPVLDPAARGGPELEFQIYTLRPGFYRLFAQVQIDGRSRFAPFGFKVVR